jgi:hypothetical protein
LKYLAAFEAKICSWLHDWRIQDTWIIHIKIQFKYFRPFQVKFSSWLEVPQALHKWRIHTRITLKYLAEFEEKICSWYMTEKRRTHEYLIVGFYSNIWLNSKKWFSLFTEWRNTITNGYFKQRSYWNIWLNSNKRFRDDYITDKHRTHE